MITIDPALRAYIAKVAKVEAPVRCVDREKHNSYARKIRIKYKEMGLTCVGTPRKNKIHPSLHGITDRKAYMKAWHKLNPNSRKRK